MGMLFCSVLLAFVSLVVGPNIRPSEEDVRNMLSTLRTELDNEDVESRKAVVRVMDANRKTWFNLVAKCHFILRDKSASPAHHRACEYVKEHDCLLGQEMAKVCPGIKKEDVVDIWLGGLKQYYIAKSSNIQYDQRSEEITLCLPRVNQMQKPHSSKQSAKAEQQTTFHRTSFYVIKDENINSCVPKLDSIAEIAQKYEEKVVSKLDSKTKGGTLKEILPDIEEVCQNVFLKHSCTIATAEVVRLVSQAIGPFFHDGPGMGARIYCQQIPANRRAAVMKIAASEYKFETLIPTANLRLNGIMDERGLSDQMKECQKKKFKEILADIPKFCLNSMAREFFTGEDSGAVKWSPTQVDPGLHYVCSIIQRQKQNIKM